MRPNCCQQPTAARLPLAGLKPLLSPEMHDVTPLADCVSLLELDGGKRAAVRPHARGGSLQLRRQTLARPADAERNGCGSFAERNHCATGKMNAIFSLELRSTSPPTG